MIHASFIHPFTKRRHTPLGITGTFACVRRERERERGKHFINIERHIMTPITLGMVAWGSDFVPGR